MRANGGMFPFYGPLKATLLKSRISHHTGLGIQAKRTSQRDPAKKITEAPKTVSLQAKPKPAEVVPGISLGNIRCASRSVSPPNEFQRKDLTTTQLTKSNRPKGTISRGSKARSIWATRETEDVEGLFAGTISVCWAGGISSLRRCPQFALGITQEQRPARHDPRSTADRRYVHSLAEWTVPMRMRLPSGSVSWISRAHGWLSTSTLNSAAIVSTSST
jgi:hypothetical protein